MGSIGRICPWGACLFGSISSKILFKNRKELFDSALDVFGFDRATGGTFVPTAAEMGAERGNVILAVGARRNTEVAGFGRLPYGNRDLCAAQRSCNFDERFEVLVCKSQFFLKRIGECDDCNGAVKIGRKVCDSRRLGEELLLALATEQIAVDLGSICACF